MEKGRKRSRVFEAGPAEFVRVMRPLVAPLTVFCSVCAEPRLWLRADGTNWCPSCRVVLDAKGEPQ